jgi:hypothetical protein
MSFRSGVLNNKILKIYIDKYINGELDFYGIKLIPTITDNKGMVWNVENPKNLSFTNYAASNFIYDSLLEYHALLGDSNLSYIELVRKISSYCYFNFGDEITNEFFEELNKEASKIKNIEFPAINKSPGFYSDCKVKVIDLFSEGNDLVLSLDVFLKNATDNLTDEIIDDEEKISNILSKLIDDGYIFDLEDDFFHNILNLISGDKRVFDMETSYTRIRPIYFFKGSRLTY